MIVKINNAKPIICQNDGLKNTLSKRSPATMRDDFKTDFKKNRYIYSNCDAKPEAEQSLRKF